MNEEAGNCVERGRVPAAGERRSLWPAGRGDETAGRMRLRGSETGARESAARPKDSAGLGEPGAVPRCERGVESSGGDGNARGVHGRFDYRQLAASAVRRILSGEAVY